MADWLPENLELEDLHPGHRDHLCVAHAMGYVHTSLNDYKKLVRNPKFVCKQCGRVAVSSENLCDPDPL